MRPLFPLALLALLGLRLEAQDPLASIPGQRIRVTSSASPGVRWVGRALAVEHDSLLMVAGDSLLHLPFAAVSRLEIARREPRGPIIAGMVVGAIAGAISGVSLAGTKCLRGPYVDRCDSTTELLAPVAGAIGGAVVGGGLVTLLQTRWARVAIIIR